MRNRSLRLTLIAVATVGCGQGAVRGPTAPSALAQPPNISESNVAVDGTFASHETGTFDYHVGDAFIQSLPATFFGGRVMLTALLTPSANPSVHLPALLQIECALGNVPAGAVEGVRLNV